MARKRRPGVILGGHNFIGGGLVNSVIIFFLGMGIGIYGGILIAALMVASRDGEDDMQ